MKHFDFHPEAGAEVAASIDYYESLLKGLGKTFYHSIEKGIEAIRLFPEAYPQFDDEPYRYFVVRRFTYVIYYEDLPDRIRIMAVCHGHRRPGYWLRRS